MNKLTIANEMAQFDAKNREFYDSLSEQEKKDFSKVFEIYQSNERECN